ncbi:MAG: TonB-dependent receptor, partial [bacterium]
MCRIRFLTLLSIAFFVLFISPTQTLAQSPAGTIIGIVTTENNEPATNATVTLDETKLGAISAEDGRFIIANVPAGLYKIKVRLIGYEQDEMPTVKVRSGDTARVMISLRQNDIEMSPVLVTGNRRQSAEDTRPSVTSMTPREAKYLPGAAEDVLRGLQALPGVTSVSDFSSQLVIRGSGPDQNLIMIDGFEVINPYRLYGVVSMFNPETVSEISLQTGGFAAQYGDRLSAVIDVKNREGRTDVPFATKLNFSLTNLNLIFEGKLPFEGSSYLLSLRRTYYDLILGPVLKSAKVIQGDAALPNFRDLQFKAGIPLGESNKLLFNFLTSRDGVSVISGSDRNRADSVSVSDQAYNTMFGTTWQINPSRDVLLNTQLSWYRNSGAGLFDGTFVDPSHNDGNVPRLDSLVTLFVRFGVQYSYVYEKSSFSQKLVWNTGRHTIESGYGADFLRTDFTRYFEIDQDLKNFISQRGFVVPTNQTEVVRFNRYNLFAQDRITLGESWFVQPGFRVDYYPFLNTKVYVSPRVNVSYKVSETATLRAAYGKYVQSPGMEKQIFQFRVTFNDETYRTLQAEAATHYVLGFDKMINASWQFKTETYFKSFNNVIVPQKLQGSKWYSVQTGDSIFTRRGWTTPSRVKNDSLTYRPVNGATGKSYGIEFVLQKIRSQTSDRFSGWVSYALSYARRERDGITSAFQFDQRHAVNIVGNQRLSEN